MKKKIKFSTVTALITTFIVFSVPLYAASGTWHSGQQYDYNGLNDCHSTNNVSDSIEFTAKVWDEFHTQLGAKTETLGKNGYISLKNAGWPGSKECVIITTSTDHSPGFDA